MRILLVSHVFLPKHPAGTEIYTFQVGLKLQARGHDVHVFTTEKDISRENLSVRLREYQGLPVHELFNNLFYNRFEETWDYPPVVESFSRLLDDLKPDVVHFMHLLYLSVGCVEEVARRGIPVFFTLHDYWLQCPRFGQRVHADNSICHEIDFDRCGTCLVNFKFKQSRLERSMAKVTARLRTTTGWNLGPALRSVGSGVKAVLRPHAKDEAPVGELGLPPARTPTQLTDPEARMSELVRLRERDLRERLLPVVYRFLAPSRFLRDRFLEWGIPPEKIQHERAGIDTQPFRDVERTQADSLRISFIGTLAPHKGVHVLIDAWESLPAELRARGGLEVYGPLAHNPGYVRYLQASAGRTGAKIAGELRRAEVNGVLARTDVLVVPSVWYENSPLIILEALATHTPLIVSDLGGMAELVDEGVTGFHFKVGEADDLALRLGALLEEPRVLDELYPDESTVKDVREDAAELEELYREALAARGSESTLEAGGRSS